MAHVTFTIADYLVFTGSLGISLGIGFYHWFRSKGLGTKDFLMGGGHMSPIPVSLSFAAGIISAVSILGNSAEMYYYGSQLWMNVIGVTIGTVFIMGIVMPVIYPLKFISIFEYLEYRWGDSLVRKMASVVQLINISIYMGMALYAPSLAISSVTPITANISVLVLGIVCTVYASMPPQPASLTEREMIPFDVDKCLSQGT
ncbi:Sodium-dependent multivitamin transporter [Chionoecetes opilio]|uniref:Sodium-dependent multivitamin transporter n=1 Tax=Chionoecetes opilio TaxID=41210 RepID=A0A8J4YPG4_CHIOP|nr:Sodium-dependent multivitamin transporter [Chionoecetes opilio]